MTVVRAERLARSAGKIRPPFALDPQLRFYSPQDNRDAFALPRVADWHDHLTRWRPREVAGTTRRLAVLLPCTMYKPYPTSREHRAINAALLGAGWMPVGPDESPGELAAALDPDEDPRVLHNGPMVRGTVVLDRIVVSEPLGLVPYDHVYYVDGRPSPATAYDDPGLFESRGTSVSPERADSTARLRADGRWAWGPAERDAYVDVHERLVEVIGTTLARVAACYLRIVAWVSPGLTHRSFLADRSTRRRDGLAASRLGARGRRPLTGVLDTHPGIVDVLPDPGQVADAKTRLAARLRNEGRPGTPGAVRAVFARGDGHDTPLGLPELLTTLTAHLDTLAEQP